MPPKGDASHSHGGKGDIPVRVCQFVVSQKSHFLFTEDEPIYALPFSFHFLLTEKDDIFTFTVSALVSR